MHLAADAAGALCAHAWHLAVCQLDVHVAWLVYPAVVASDYAALALAWVLCAVVAASAAAAC